MAAIGRWGLRWVRLNGVLFVTYALFGVASISRPAPLPTPWFLPLHLATLAANLLIAYGLFRRRLRINYIVVFVSAMMAGHLLIFILSPLGMALAYIGPSRAFYALFLTAVTRLSSERMLPAALLVFNLLMLFVHLANIGYFSRRKVADLFRQRSGDAVAV